MKSLLLAILSCLCIARSGAEPVRLVFVGDIMLDDGPGKVIARGRNPIEAFSRHIHDADFAIGNLECPVATTGNPVENKIATFRADPAVTPVLKRHFNALAISNNHSGDYGKAAFIETMNHLDQANIPYFGGGRNLSEAHKPLWIERNGLRIAVLGFNEYKPRSFEAGTDHAGLAWSEDSHVISDIRAARKSGADLIIPFMHWGWEREPHPTERQRKLARRMIDAGADVVVGGHPHVTQGAEYYRGRLIVYSLGNFVFDGFDYPEGKIGWLLHLTLDRKGLIAWKTLAAQMDEEGTPHPIPGALTPCGKEGETRGRQCVNP